MLWFKRNPFFYSSLAVLIVGVLMAMWMVQKRQSTLKDLEKGYVEKSNRLDRFLLRKPSPTGGNLEALNENFTELYEVYEQVLSGLSLNTYDKDRFLGTDPLTRTDAFFEIARYVEDLRKYAVVSNAPVDRSQRFGFSEYTNVGPEEIDISIVHRQVKVMEFLLQALFDSEVSDFVGIQRENPRSIRSVTSGSVKNSGKGDLFVLDPAESIRTEGVLSSMAFKVTFRSQSLGVRNFINRIIDSSLPFVVCSLAVGSDSDNENRGERGVVADNPFSNPAEGDQIIKAAQVPIVSENQSTFSVTIEFLEEIESFKDIADSVIAEGGSDA